MDGNQEEAQAEALPDPHEIAGLIRTALYDTDGEIVEGAFVDRWESNAGNAVEALEQIFERQGCTEENTALLRQAVSQPQAPLKAVISLLSELGRWTYPFLQAMRNDPSPQARLVAVCALGNSRLLWLSSHPLDPDVLLVGLEDTHAEVREAAVQTLAQYQVRINVPQAKEVLAHALDDEEPRVRIAAGSNIGFLERPEGGAALVRRLEMEPDNAVRQAILLAIARQIATIGAHVGYSGGTTLRQKVGEPLTALLVRALPHPNTQVRQNIALALYKLRGADVGAAMLEQLQQEKDLEVRYALLSSPYSPYGKIVEQALPVLAALLASDPSPIVRSKAVWVLKDLKPESLPLLHAALENPMPEVRQAATRVLEMISKHL